MVIPLVIAFAGGMFCGFILSGVLRIDEHAGPIGGSAR